MARKQEKNLLDVMPIKDPNNSSVDVFHKQSFELAPIVYQNIETIDEGLGQETSERNTTDHSFDPKNSTSLNSENIKTFLKSYVHPSLPAHNVKKSYNLRDTLRNKTLLSEEVIEKLFAAEYTHRRRTKSVPDTRRWLQSAVSRKAMESNTDLFLQKTYHTVDTSKIRILQAPRCTFLPHEHKFRIFIKSHLNSERGIQRRNYIRKTWGKYYNIIFTSLVFNEGLLKKTKVDDDMLVLGGFSEHVNHLTHKVYGALLYSEYCKNKTGLDYYTVFTDDDVYNFLPEIETNIINPYLAIENEDINNVVNTCKYFGNFHYSDKPFREQKSKYYVPEKHYPYEIYPPYCSGMTYILSPCAMRAVQKQMRRVPIIRHVDDVYVGLLVYYHNLNANIPIDLHHDARFSTAFEYNSWRCDIFNLHQVNVDSNFLRNKQDLCKTGYTFNNVHGADDIYNLTAIGF